jgi:hypothetical protein
MAESEGTPKQKIFMQLLLLLVGASLVLSHNYWDNPLPVLLSGVFFINLCWITLVLGHDLKIWGWLRNHIAGNLAMIAIILVNLIAVAVTAFMH